MPQGPVPESLTLKPRQKGTSGQPSLYIKEINIQRRKARNSDKLELCRLVHRMKAKHEDTLIG